MDPKNANRTELGPVSESMRIFCFVSYKDGDLFQARRQNKTIDQDGEDSDSAAYKQDCHSAETSRSG